MLALRKKVTAAKCKTLLPFPYLSNSILMQRLILCDLLGGRYSSFRSAPSWIEDKPLSDRAATRRASKLLDRYNQTNKI